MYKKIAILLSAAMLLNPAAAYAEDFSAGEEADIVSDNTDAISDETATFSVEDSVSEENTEVETEGSSEEETETEVEYSDEDSLFGDGSESLFSDGDSFGDVAEESVEETIDSGFVASDGWDSGISLFSFDEYTGSYGAQLDSLNGYAPDVYNILVKNFAENWTSVTNGTSVRYTLPEEITFTGTADDSSGTPKLVKDDNFNEAKKPLYEAVCAAWPAFLYDYPEAFWMPKLNFSYTVNVGTPDDDGNAEISITGIQLTPATLYGDSTADAIKSFHTNVDAAAAQLTDETAGSTLYGKVKAVHDYVCNKGYYDHNGVYTSSSSATDDQKKTHTAGPLFVDGADGGVVCEGYAKAVKILCDRLGIPCACVIGQAKSTSSDDTDAHMWDYVQMGNGSWYLVDATWDDASTPKSTYLLVGSSSMGTSISISEERTNSQYFYTLSGDYDMLAFTYPALSDISYKDYVSDIGNAEITVGEQYYTGSPICPDLSVSILDEAVTDYTVAYKNNTGLGTATATVTGTGSCTGSKSVTFAILCPHTGMSHTGASAATCTANGTKEYWHCGICGRYFSDSAGSAETTLQDTVISAAGHSLTAVPAKEPTCTEGGNVAYWRCGSCGKCFLDAAGKTETSNTALAAAGHALSAVPAKAATCTEDGNRAYWKCNSCGKYFSDSSASSEISNTVIKATGHTLSAIPAKAATCTEKGNIAYWKCSSCGKCFLDAAGKTETANTAIAATGHALRAVPAKAAACTAAGNLAYWECSSCGKRFSDSKGMTEAGDVTVPAAGHELKKVDAKEPTTEAEGNIAYWKCSSCEKTFSDADGKTEVSNVTVPKLTKLSGSLSVSLSRYSFVYNGKIQTPGITVYYNGTKLGNSEYSVSVSNNKNIGTATVSVKGKGKYSSCSGSVSFKITAGKFTTKLSRSSYTYNGKARKPSVKVYANGKQISSRYYSVTYSANKNPGYAKVVVKGKGVYTYYNSTSYFRILPKKETLSYYKSTKKKTMTVKWKKDKTVTGYQMQVSQSKSFKGSTTKTYTAQKNGITSTTFKGLKSKKNYYVRIRAYKNSSGKVLYGGWSSVKKAKVK